MPKDMRTYRGYGNRRYSGRITFFIVLAIAVLIIAAAAAAVLLQEGGMPPVVQEGIDPAAVPGDLIDGPVGDLSAIDAFSYRIAKSIPVKKSVAQLSIENPAENRQWMKVILLLEDGTQVYATDFIKPYHYILQDKLDAALPAGTYPCTARIEAYDSASLEKLSQADEPVTLLVE